MAVRKKTKRTTKKNITNSTSRRKDRTFTKPLGLRVEDLKPGQIVKFNAHPAAGTPDEFHIVVPSSFGIRKDTIRIDPKTHIVTVDELPCDVGWNYQLEILKDHSFMMSTKDGRTIGKLFKRRFKGQKDV